jgi:uncharacterized protein (DUF1501 family)
MLLPTREFSPALMEGGVEPPHSREAAMNLFRRDLLKAAFASGLSFTLPGLDLRAAERRGDERQKSLIVVWLGGGASQLETWDPHPGTAIGGPTKSIKTKVAGLEIADLYPRVAEQIHELNVIRSLVSKEGDHERGTYMLKTGYRPDPTLIHPSLGAIACHELPNEKIEIPSHISLLGSQWPARGGFLGEMFDAFKIYDPGSGIRNLKARVGDDRQQQRLKALDIVSKSFQAGRRVQVENTLHQLTVERALRMMTSEQLKAFELDQEPAAIREAYGDSRFGRGCLTARRLVETGVRAIEVTLMGWDTHANNFEGHKTQAKELDPALAALIHDLQQRDLLASTVVLCLSEFGRTPRINPLDGRDHWPKGFSCLVGGGGLRSGVVIGETDTQPQSEQDAVKSASKSPHDPIEVPDLFATVLRQLGVEFDKEMLTPVGRPMKLSSGKPIERLIAST